MPRIEESKRILLNGKADPVPPETVVFEKTSPGTYTLQIPGDGYYEVYSIGAGGSFITSSDFIQFEKIHE